MYYKSIVTTPIIGSIVKILVKRQCRKRLPAILEWVNEITTYYKQNAPYTSELNISRLPDYYPQPLLQNTQVAIVKRYHRFHLWLFTFNPYRGWQIIYR